MICISRLGNLGFGGKVNTFMQFHSVSKFPLESKNTESFSLEMAASGQEDFSCRLME